MTPTLPNSFLIVILLLSSFTVPQAQSLNSAGIEDTISKVSTYVEDIRGLSFKYKLPIELVSRDEVASTLNLSESGWELAQQEYEALYLIPPGVSAKELLEGFYSSAVLGYYDPEEKKIVIVKEAEESLDKNVLAHELTHALLDQYYPETFRKHYGLTDKDLAVSAVLEGDAELVEELYTKAVEEGKYQDCNINFNLNSPQPYLGILYIQYFPYLEGYNFIKRLQKRGGWEAVNQAYLNPPESTEQIIHPSKYPWEKPINVNVRGAGFKGWSKLGDDILGEAAIFIMFWNQGLVNFPYGVEGRLTYNSPLSEGWAGDRMVVYKKNGKYGYVWLLSWDTEQDASEFTAGYVEMLRHIGSSWMNGVWKLSTSDYVIIWQEKKKVTIVNAPLPQQIDEIMMAAGLFPLKVEGFKANKLNGAIEFIFSLKNLTPEDQPATLIVQIRNSKGKIIGLSYVSVSLPANSSLGFSMYSAIPKPGIYQAKLYVWRSFKEPIPLSPPQLLEVS